jgi:hypothetical protein
MAEENTFVALDSLSANEFRVEINGQQVEGIFRISGFKPFDFVNTGGINTLLMTKMVQRDGNNPFNKWVRESITTLNMDVNPTRTLTIIAVDDGTEIRRWTLNGAYLTNLSYSDFDSGSTELVEEQVVIQYDSVEIQWTATPNLE